MILRKILLLTLLIMMASPLFAQRSRYMIVFLNPNPHATHSEEEVKIIMAGHTEVREKLSKEGKLLAAGPFEGGGGIYILADTTEAQALSRLNDDPGIEKKHWLAEIFPYQPRHGGICPVGENYTMTKYTFVRFDVIITKSTAQNFPDLLRKHDKHLDKIIEGGNVVTEAVFGDRDGGILIIKGEIEPGVIESDPAIQEGLIQYQMKKFYTAKGAFCEE